MGMQPILPITVSIKKIKGAARQCYGNGDGVIWCEQTLSVRLQSAIVNPKAMSQTASFWDGTLFMLYDVA